MTVTFIGGSTATSGQYPRGNPRPAVLRCPGDIAATQIGAGFGGILNLTGWWHAIKNVNVQASPVLSSLDLQGIVRHRVLTGVGGRTQVPKST